jgi:2-amino-4-hydroxy-6-hydroxymethyldihydropteridine diphosphokinase
MTMTILALGSNLPGPSVAGVTVPPAASLRQAVRQLQSLGVKIHSTSAFYQTKAVGGHAPDYVNAIVIASNTGAPAAFLRTLKQLERGAGRRVNRRWGPRPLDIDIIATGTQHYNWPARRAGTLTLPHPEAHWRAFVLVPLASIRPNWYHPGKNRTARQLLARLPARDLRGLRRLD